jgi:NAD(P)-dependent dehydrogenase (short-subunit alcohol dehydrogenase family)
MAQVENSAARVCLLTGASGTLGSAFCDTYGKKYKIVAVHFSHDLSVCNQNQRLVDPLQPSARLARNDITVFSVRADLRSDAELERVVELALARFGKIDLVVNSASYTVLAPMLHCDDLLNSLGQQFQLHVYVPLKLATVIARMFWRDRVEENKKLRRNVVNISSTSGSIVYPGLGQGGYAACKSALEQLTRHMALEFASIGIRVNALSPNSFPKSLPTKRVIDEIAEIDRTRVTGEIRMIEA